MAEYTVPRLSPVAPVMPPQLVALSEGPSIYLDKPILLFGRDLECDVRFDSRKISRKHCCIAQVNDYLVIRDLGSTNGIRINGRRVLEGRLRPGDELIVGPFRYQLRWDEQAVAPRRKPGNEPARGADDEMLELCDSPLALPEPPGKHPDPPPQAGHAPVNGHRTGEHIQPPPLLPGQLGMPSGTDSAVE